jgi:hypothetical protein
MKQLTRTQQQKTLMTIDLYDLIMKCNMIEDTSDSVREVQLVFAPWGGGGGGVMKTQNWSQRVLYQEYLLHSVIMHCFFT